MKTIIPHMKGTVRVKGVVKRIERQPGMINLVSDWLYRLEDIQKAMGELGLADHNDKLFDILTGFPNKEDKTVGELVPERKLMVNIKTERIKDGKTLSDTTYRMDKDKMTIVEEKENGKETKG